MNLACLCSIIRDQRLSPAPEANGGPCDPGTISWSDNIYWVFEQCALLHSFSPCSLIFLPVCLYLHLVLQAPGDAEALCAWLMREGTVDAVASEDMDTLPFGANILIRQLNAKKDRYKRTLNLCGTYRVGVDFFLFKK